MVYKPNMHIEYIGHILFLDLLLTKKINPITTTIIIIKKYNYKYIHI